jgi:hypothetical protein
MIANPTVDQFIIPIHFSHLRSGHGLEDLFEPRSVESAHDAFHLVRYHITQPGASLRARLERPHRHAPTTFTVLPVRQAAAARVAPLPIWRARRVSPRCMPFSRYSRAASSMPYRTVKNTYHECTVLYSTRTVDGTPYTREEPFAPGSGEILAWSDHPHV